MTHASLRALGVFLACLLVPHAAADQAAAVSPNLTAAEIVERVRAAERWITEADSFFLRAESLWSRSEESIVQQRKEMERLYGRDAVPENHPDLAPHPRSSVDIAFDTWRVRMANEGSDGRVELKVWDGEKALMIQGTTDRPIMAVGLGDHPSFVAGHLLTELAWPRAENHTLWFSDPSMPAAAARRADQFTLVGREEFRGLECHMLDADGGFHRWYVDVEEGLLRGTSQCVLRQDADVLSLVAPIAERRGQAVRTWEEWGAWNRALSAEERESVMEEYWAAVLPLSRPFIDQWLDDYEEVAPGWRIPRTQGYIFREENAQGEVFEAMRRDIRIVDVRVNERLDDDLFRVEVPDGVEVSDSRFDPIHVTYPWKKDRTEEEFEAILEQGRREHDERLTERRHEAEIIGRPAPPLPEGARWLNGEAMTWESLRGKPVVLTFFANWCGPCRGTYPQAIDFFERRERHGVVLIGVHAPGPVETVERFIESVSITYPVVIDVPADPGVPAWGTFFAGCRVRGIPHALLIDAEGNVAGRGSLDEMIRGAQGLRRRE